MPEDRQGGRTVLFFLSSNPDDCIGGCMHYHFTQHDLYDFVGILVIAQASDASVGSSSNENVLEVRMRGSQTALENSADIPLSPGDYLLAPKYGSDRAYSRSVISRDRAFRSSLRRRDGGCVLTGVINRDADGDSNNRDWLPFESAHIWPLCNVTEWVRQSAGRWITDSDGLSEEAKMNSPQNGILLCSTSHVLFDSHDLAINPKADYKIYPFDHDSFGYSGKHMSIRARENSDIGVRDALLLWHFR
ncbi:hypothetical protein TWF694_000504 [Orbilia ellipsospora]|uniref:HNH nuclease domain-containing protein n=1 Tax=Orbilia ellipsospora TaxID=2528407 RepID=A0AAV9XS56_9PEZI